MFFGKYFCFYFIIKLEIINIYVDTYHKARDPGVQQCLISLQGLPGGPFWAAMSQEPQKPGAAFPHTRRITALKVKGPKTLKPPPTHLPKVLPLLSCPEGSLQKQEGGGWSSLGDSSLPIVRTGEESKKREAVC